jgi:hypothetical protein
MSYATLILGESGTGKTASLRNFDPSQVLLIQPVRKPLPFKSVEWKGHIYVSDSPVKIVSAMQRTQAEVVIVDDLQYVLSNMFMAKRNERGFDKFTEIAGAGFDICKTASELPENKRVYILAHTQTGEDGTTRIKTIGKLLDEKIVPEGMFTTVLRTLVNQDGYFFRTQNSGADTVKSPLGLFDEALIENDLAAVDKAIVDYYGIGAEPDPDSPATGA